MPEETKSTATPAPAAPPATTPAAQELSPIAKIFANLDDQIKKQKAILDTLGKLKSDAQKAVQFAKTEKMSDTATLAILREMMPKVPKGGRPKGSTNATKSVGGRGHRISDAKRAKILKLHAGKMSNNAIAKKVGVSPKTVASYV